MTPGAEVDRKLKHLADHARRGRGFSQGEIARRVGCSQQYISKIEAKAVEKIKDLMWPVWKEFRR